MSQKLSEVYRKAAVEFAQRVTAVLGAQVDAIVLYGSVARGEARRDSDIDILVVSPDPQSVRQRVSEICENVIYECDYTLFISTVHLSREELRWHIEVRSPFVCNVIDEGVILYDNGTFSSVCGKGIAASR